MQPFAIVAPRREAAHPAMWVGVFKGEPRLVNDPAMAIQFAREHDARGFIAFLDPGYEWGVTQDFANPPVPGEGGFTSAETGRDPKTGLQYPSAGGMAGA